MKIKTDNKEFKFLQQTIDEWVSYGNISPEKATELKKTLEVPKTSNQQIAQYFFFIALSCILLAFGAIFIDDKFLEKLKQYFSLTNLFIAILFTAFSIIAFAYLKKKKATINPVAFEVYTVVAGLLLVTAITYYCKEIGFGPKYSGFLIVTATLLFSLSLWLRSYAMWVAGILAFMGWFGAFSTWFSVNDLFMGMNYPMRFSVFGLLITGFAILQRNIKAINYSHKITYITGLIILFTALWGISIFGNYNSFEHWASVRQTQIIFYAIAFALIAGITFFLGIKYKDQTARDIGILALLANLYTRYFEYFWDTTNKGLFFLILAISFWFLGKRIERWKSKKEDTNNTPEIS